MIELYNHNNIKVYADRDEYEITRDRFGNVQLYNTVGNLKLDITNLDKMDCTIILQGNTLTMYGTNVSAVLNDIDYNLVLKGSLFVILYSTNQIKATCTLHDTVRLRYNGPIGYSQKHPEFILHDNTDLRVSYSSVDEPLKVFMYGNSECKLLDGTADITAFDNSKVGAYRGVKNFTAMVYDNAIISAYPTTEVITNDETKLEIL